MHWLFVRGWMRTYTGYSSGIRVFLRKIKEKKEFTKARGVEPSSVTQCSIASTTQPAVLLPPIFWF